ncbi:hypothetical protein [Sphingomonas sp. 3-13AW]|uniref:hypothetical protein n=1 Tax=Sphingomonas sp. 3-13AW TaxID=3050450 RepID=UPI003BB65448
MTSMRDEVAFFENLTIKEVGQAFSKVRPDLDFEVLPSMFDAGVVVRHPPGQGPTLEDADRIADILRSGRPLQPDKADWHVTGFAPYCDALDPSVVYGTWFGLVRAFLPPPATLARIANASLAGATWAKASPPSSLGWSEPLEQHPGPSLAGYEIFEHEAA